jgi:SAM-dependent methyltransferase
LRRLPPPGTIFDIGGGNGYVDRAMQDAGLDVVMVEPGAEGIQNALGRGVRNVVRGTLDDLHPAPGSLAAVSLFDVLEHIPDDIGFLRQIHSLMKPGGRIYITVPAYQWLWSHEDSNAGHARRYTRSPDPGSLYHWLLSGFGTLFRLPSTSIYCVESRTGWACALPLQPRVLRASTTSQPIHLSEPD